MRVILGAVVRAHTRCTLVRNLRSLPTSCFSTLFASKAMPPGVPPGEAVFFLLRGEENMAADAAQDLQHPSREGKITEHFMSGGQITRKPITDQ